MSQNDDKQEELELAQQKSMDRREFMKRSAVGAGAMAVTMMTGCGSSSSSNLIPVSTTPTVIVL